jgi:hypothetical protein
VLRQGTAPSSDISSTKGVGPPTVPLKAGTDEGLLKLLLFVPMDPPTVVPVKPGTLDGLLRLGFEPSVPPVTVPVKPDTVDGLLKLVFTVLPSAGTAAFEPAFVFEPAPVDVVVLGLPTGATAVPPETVMPLVTLEAVVPLETAATAGTVAPLTVVVTVADVVTAEAAAVVVGVGVVATGIAEIVVGAATAVGPMTPTIGATFDGMPPVAWPSTAAEMIASGPVPAAIPTPPATGATWASARSPASASAAPRASVRCRRRAMRSMSRKQAIDVPVMGGLRSRVGPSKTGVVQLTKK